MMHKILKQVVPESSIILLLGLAGVFSLFAVDHPSFKQGSAVDTVTSSRSDSLPDTIYLLNRIVVRSSKSIHEPRPAWQPSIVFSSDDLNAAAGAAGDICRYIAMLPSTVSSLGDNFDNSFYVRGGRSSENIFVVDGIELENINHFSQTNGSGGQLGFINGEFVKQVDFFAGNAPVAYPARLSSVAAIDMRGGSLTRRRHSIGCKLTGGMFSTEGPFGKRNSSYVLAGRYIDFSTLERFIRGRVVPRLGDAYVKATLLHNDAGLLSATGLFSYNDYRFHYPVTEREDVSALPWNNTIVEARRILQGGGGITYQLKRETVSHRADASLSFRSYGGSDSLGNFIDTFFVFRYADNPIRISRDARLRAVIATRSDIAFNAGRFLTFGTRCDYHQYRLFTVNNRQYRGMYALCSDGGAAVIVRLDDPPIRRSMLLEGLEAGGYAEAALAEDRAEASLGLRADYYHLLQAAAVSPRLAATFRDDRLGSLTATCGIQHQFPADMPSLFFNFLAWFTDMSDSDAAERARSFLSRIKPLRCYQATIGYERQLAPWMALKTESYIKWYDREYHFVSPKKQEVLYVNSDGVWDLRPQNGKRRAYGLELSLSGPKRDGITYTIAGSVFDVKNRYSDGNWYDDWTNVRYTVSGSLGLRLFHHHHFSTGAQGHGGRPYCPQFIVQDCIGRKSAVYQPGTDYYSQQLERFFSTSIRYGFEKSFHRVSTELFVEILNILNRQPTLEYRFNGETLKEVKPFGIVPITGMTIVW